MWKIAALMFVVCHTAAKEGCQSGTWYNLKYAKCSPCQECGPKLFKLVPCTSTQDTMCIDLKKFKIDFHKAISPRDPPQKPIDQEDYQKKEVAIHKPEFYKFVKEWGMILTIVLCITMVTIVAIIAFSCVSKTSLCGNRKNGKRTRMFSRDRLNTTDYMNNLASLDRRLAMDEILEKRKTAIFEPQLLNENLYSDDVFIDASGFPRHDHDYESLDNRRSLLATSDHQ